MMRYGRIGHGVEDLVKIKNVLQGCAQKLFLERLSEARVIVDGRRTLQPLEIPLLIKLYRKRSMGALISLGGPIDNTRPYIKGVLSQKRLNSIRIPAKTA